MNPMTTRMGQSFLGDGEREAIDRPLLPEEFPALTGEAGRLEAQYEDWLRFGKMSGPYLDAMPALVGTLFLWLRANQQTINGLVGTLETVITAQAHADDERLAIIAVLADIDRYLHGTHIIDIPPTDNCPWGRSSGRDRIAYRIGRALDRLAIHGESD